MTIRHMRIFVAVYQTGSITRAAEQLFMSQPSVTRAIQELEQHYGVHLFERINRRLAVTEAGRRFYARALHIADTFDLMERELRDWDELGVLRVGSTITLGNVLMPDLVEAFQEQHPALRVEVTISNAAQLQQALLDNRLDLALVEGAVQSGMLQQEAFAEDHLVPVFPAAHPLLRRQTLCLADLQGERFLLRELGSAGRTFLDQVFAQHGQPLQPQWESASTRALLQAVGKGLGISILPEQLVRWAVEEGLVTARPLEDEPFFRRSYLVWHRHKFLTTSAQAFMDLCREMTA